MKKRDGPPKGHDYSQTIRYLAITTQFTRLAFCHDCGRPIPTGVRAFRRIDTRQDYPLICNACHEGIEASMYRRVTVLCICGEELHWAADTWLHEDQAIRKYRWETCEFCKGAEGGCRRCLHKGRVQVFDHEATPAAIERNTDDDEHGTERESTPRQTGGLHAAAGVEEAGPGERDEAGAPPPQNVQGVRRGL